MDSSAQGNSQDDLGRSPLSATEERQHRTHRTHASHHRHGRSRSQSRSRHHHHHHHSHHRRHGRVREDFDEADRQMLRSPQTACGPAPESHIPSDVQDRGLRTAPMEARAADDGLLHVPGSRPLPRLNRPFQTPSRTETPAPTYNTNAPSEAGDYVRRPVASPSRPTMTNSQSLPSSLAKASPRTLAYVHEQRSRVLQPPPQVHVGHSDVPSRVHFKPSVGGTATTTTNTHTDIVHAHATAREPHHGIRDSISTLHEELSHRDRRFSNMVDHCFRDSHQYSQAFAKNTVRNTAQSGDLRKRNKQRVSMVDSIMGFDEMTPQDLVYGEGSKVDGGFGFALPSRYREGSVLLDSGPAHFCIDSSSSDTESTVSYSSALSGFFGYRGSRQGAPSGKHQQHDSRSSTASSFFGRSRQPHTLADRVTNANLRPPPLNLHKSSVGRTTLPSRLRESSLADEVKEQEANTGKMWEEVHLDTDGRGASKNDRLAAALGVKKPVRAMSRDESETTAVCDDGSSSFEKVGQHEAGRVSKYQSTYTKHEDPNRRSSVAMPQGMSQADIVAICLVQGMVPPGLPPDPTLVTWSSPLSPTNPRNWSPFHKWYACVLVSVATFLANAGTNMLAPALGLISKTYQEIYTPAIRGLLIGFYVLAFAFAPLIFGPMSEVLGRKPVLLIGCAFFFIFTLASGFVSSSPMMMFFRFLTALGASAPMSIGGAVITDIFSPEQRGSAMTVFALAPQLGPVLGPIMGGWVTQEIQNWRWIFWIKAIAIAICCFPILFIKESYTPRILAQRADRLRKETKNAELTTIFERRRETVAQIFTRGTIRPLVLFGSEPIIQMICVYVSVIYGVIHLLVATFPAVMGTVYAEYPGWASMHFITIGVGTITGGIAGGFLTEFHYKRLTRRNGGIARPEFKLFSLLYMTWLGPIGLSGYFFITYWGVHWIFADVSIVIFCFGISAAVVSLQSYIVDCFSLLAGSALTSTIVVRSFFGFGATVAAEDLLLRGGLFWSGVSLSTLCIVTCVPVVFIVYFRGAAMRSKSKYATHKR